MAQTRELLKNFLVELARIIFRLDVNECELPGIGPSVQVTHRHRMRVDEARSRWLGSELIPKVAARRDYQAVLFSRTIHRRRNNLAVPVNQFRSIRIVEQIDR